MELQNPVQRGLSISSRLQAVPLWHQWPQTVEMLAGHREHAFWPRQGAQASRLQRHALTDVAHERAHTHIPPCHVSDSWANSRVCRVSRRKRLAYSLRLVSYYRVTVLISQQHHQFDNALCCYQIYFQIKHQHQHDQIVSSSRVVNVFVDNRTTWLLWYFGRFLLFYLLQVAVLFRHRWVKPVEDPAVEELAPGGLIPGRH